MELKEIISSFGFEVIALPDISTSLSGHLLTGFSPLTRGGVPLDSMLQSLQSGLTIAIGGSMERPARRLHNALGTPYKVFEGAMGLKATDELLHFLHQISGSQCRCAIAGRGRICSTACWMPIFSLPECRL